MKAKNIIFSTLAVILAALTSVYWVAQILRYCRMAVPSGIPMNSSTYLQYSEHLEQEAILAAPALILFVGLPLFYICKKKFAVSLGLAVVGLFATFAWVIFTGPPEVPVSY